MDTTVVITREEAIEAGLVRFWDGVPCERGHIAERWVANCACVECTAGQLTPGQFAYVFKGGTGPQEEFVDKRKSVTTWGEWEVLFAQLSMQREASTAGDSSKDKTERGGRRHGANHGFKSRGRGRAKRGPSLNV